MKYYFKTTGIYSNSETIQVQIEYKKGVGYNVVADAIHIDSEHGMISKSFDKEYYQFYNDLSMSIVPCSRKSKKCETVAEAWLNNETAREFAEKWIAYAVERGGRTDIKIIDVEIN